MSNVIDSFVTRPDSKYAQGHVDLPALDYVLVRDPGSMDSAHAEEAINTAVGESLSPASPRSIGDIFNQPAAFPRVYYHALKYVRQTLF